MLSCDCLTLEGLAHFQEVADNYGIEGDGSPWGHNLIDSLSKLHSCGRIYGGSTTNNTNTNTTNATLSPTTFPHKMGEVDLCTTAASACSAALSNIYVYHGDESDHRWTNFTVQIIEGENFLSSTSNDNESVDTPLSATIIHKSFNLALFPDLNFVVTPIVLEIGKMEVEEAAQNAPDHGEVKAWKDAVNALEAHGIKRISYFRPVEGHHVPGCVFPHFIIGFTPLGSITGVIGITVWT